MAPPEAEQLVVVCTVLPALFWIAQLGGRVAQMASAGASDSIGEAVSGGDAPDAWLERTCRRNR